MPHPSDYKAPGGPFIELQSVDSTNNYARQLINSAKENGNSIKDLNGTTIFTHEQPAGKGQRSKSWHSEKNANILMSVIIDPAPLNISQQFHLICAVSLAVYKFFAAEAGSETRIKWPNDLYWRERKAGGILVENIVRNSSWECAIVGIGININQTVFPEDVPNPVSLKQITGKNFPVVEMAKKLSATLQESFSDLHKNGFDKTYQEYLFHLYKRNESVRFRKENAVFDGTIRSVTPKGKLLVQHSVEEEFDFGSIEWLQ